MSEAAITNEQSLLPERIENARSLLIVLALMALLAGLALLFSRGATRLSADWQSQLSDTVTVQILNNSTETREAQMQAAAELLQNLLPEAEITPLSEADASALLDPWLGDIDLPTNLPVPGLITLKHNQGDIPVEQISAAMQADGLLVNIDDHRQFSDGIEQTARRLVLLGSSLLTILLAAGLFVSVFATRAGLSAQRDIIRVLVQVGANNDFIAKLFIGQAAKRGLVGALFGLSLAAIIWAVLSISGLAGDMGWQGAGQTLIDVIWLIGFGAVFVLICAMAAGLTATRQLSRERRRE